MLLDQYPWCSCFLFALIFLCNYRLGLSSNRNNEAVMAYKTIFVDQSGSGHFSSIQSAIDSIPSNNTRWICIYIKAGTYREKVHIPYDKPYIILKGEGKRTTSVFWDDHASIAQSPTFMSSADNIVVKRIGFVNSYNMNFPKSKNPVVPAVAAMISGDKTAFYECGFAGVQDTLWDDQGRHYFKHCSIQGSVDFIFGSGQSLYEDCSIRALGEGYITAQGRSNPNDSNGFVFKGCKVFGTGPAYLGRAWRAYSRVLFYESKFSNVVQPDGWDAWWFVGHENRLTFAEFGNFGPGADTSKRVNWANKLSTQSLDELTSMSFIDTENWIQQQPYDD